MLTVRDLPKAVLQIVPRLPNGLDGVADYAAIIAKALQRHYAVATVFAPAETTEADAPNGFEVLPLQRIDTQRSYEHIILHFVSYGYHKRGIPLKLLGSLRRARAVCRGRFLTIFHELFPSAPAWKSAFWLRPLQVHIVREIAALSDLCVVTNQPAVDQLRGIAPQVDASVHPVFSNFGEPRLPFEQVADRSSHCWAICGGTQLILRSLRSFEMRRHLLPHWCSPQELLVLGGQDDERIRRRINALTGLQTKYRPQISASEASQLLRGASFAWLDYFHNQSVPAAVLLKSGSFAACCSHGVIPVFPHRLGEISFSGCCLRGLYFVDVDVTKLPDPAERAQIGSELHDWYHHHASSDEFVTSLARTLRVAP